MTVKYLDYHGETQTLDADELLATCVQHEMDHLDGIVFVDHISKLKREMIEGVKGSGGGGGEGFDVRASGNGEYPE